MKFFVLSSAKYQFLLKYYATLFNKYWDPSINVNILGSIEPNLNLPCNFNYISLEEKKINQWTDVLIPFFSKLKDEFFFLCFEDHMLIKSVDKVLFDEALVHMQKDKNIVKTWLLCKPSIKNPSFSEKFYRWKDSPGCLIPTSLLPSIWRTDYFLRLLKPNVSPWQFEENNKRKSFAEGEYVIYPKEWPIYPSVDAMRRGSTNNIIFERYAKDHSVGPQVWQQNLSKEDIDMFSKIKEEWGKING